MSLDIRLRRSSKPPIGPLSLHGRHPAAHGTRGGHLELNPGLEKAMRAFASATSGPTHTKAAVTARLAHPQAQELLPCAVNQRAWWSRIIATASAALSTQHGICMSCGLASSNP